MASVSDLLHYKDSAGTAQLVTIAPSATVLEATKLMNACHIGSVLVRSENGALAGILTERDLLTRVLAAECDPKTTSVGAVMTTGVVTCSPSTSIDELKMTFRERHIRHIPVCAADGQLCGMVSIGDVNAWDHESLEATVNSLTDYITRA